MACDDEGLKFALKDCCGVKLPGCIMVLEAVEGAGDMVCAKVAGEAVDMRCGGCCGGRNCWGCMVGDGVAFDEAAGFCCRC